MKACIVNIGDEILIGQIINTNAAWMAEKLNLLGITVEKTVVVADEEAAIIEGLEIGMKQADIVLITGGLGPTKDDITKTTLSKYFGMELVYHAPSFDNIAAILAQYGKEADDRYKIQAFMPDKATILINKTGTASGMWFEQQGKVIVSMPGVPREVYYLMEKEVLPRLQEQFQTPTILHKTLLSIGKGETDLSELLEDFEASLPSSIKMAYLPNSSIGAVRLRLSARGENLALVQEQLTTFTAKLRTILGALLFGEDKETLAEAIGKILLKKNWNLATAESCTGGMIAQQITSVAGSSAYYPGTVVAYANAVKMNIFGVSAATLEDYGAVSEQCVSEMAKGVQKLLGTNCAIAVSGIAGPGGAKPNKPVGTIWVAVLCEEQLYTKKLTLGKERLQNISRTTNIALNLLRRMLIGDLDLDK